MKKFTLLLCLFVVSVMMPQVAVAQQTYPSVNYDGNTKTLTITTDQAGSLTTSLVSSYTAAETIVLVGPFNSGDLDVIGSGQGFTNVKNVNMADARFENNNGSSNLYILYNNSGIPSYYNPQLGQKALTGGTLYQLSVTTNKSWGDPISEPESLDGVKTYNNQEAMLNDANNSSDGTIGRYPSGEYNYYMMNVNRYWDPTSDPGNVSNSVTILPPTDEYEPNTYIKVATAGTYYEMVVTKGWEEINNPGQVAFENIDWTEDVREQHLNYDIGTYIVFESYEYYQYVEGEYSWEHALVHVDGPTEAGTVYYFSDGYSAAYDARWNNEGNPKIGDYAKVPKNTYYIMAEKSRDWHTTVADPSDATIPYFTEDQKDNDDKKSIYADGDVIMFPTAYDYYLLNETRAWSGPTSSMNPASSGYDEPDNPYNKKFTESERDNHKTEYNDKQSIRFPVYIYHALTETQTRSWGEAQAYNDERQETIQHLYANISERDADNTASHQEYAVVGATEYVYKASGWSTDLTPDPDYSAMEFSNWSSTLQTAVLPNNVTVADCPNDLFKGCNVLTEVKHNVNNVAKSAKITIETGKVTVNKAEEAGLFKLLLNSDPKLFESDPQRFASGTVFKFSEDCGGLNGADLAALAGNMKDANNGLNHNKFYVDLFDVPVASPSTIGTAINDAISIMREKNWQYKGLLFPGNLSSASTQVIKDRDEDVDKKATCSEFVGYNKNSNEITTMHIYSADNSGYQDNFDRLWSMMGQHSDIAQKTTSYLVSTNSPSEFNTSSLPTTTADVILAVNDDMVNPVPGAKAGVSVTLAGAGHFATLVANTGIKDTPVDSLKITGNVNIDDISSVSAFVDGPRVLNLKAAVPTEKIVEEQSDDFDDKAMLETLENNKIEFIILHSGKSKDVVCSADTSKLKSLKAVISSNKRGDANPALVAYVNVPGSLAEARCLATGNSGSGSDIHPTPQGLTSVTLAGRLYLSDISLSSSSDALYHPNNQPHTITTLDLENAVFVNQKGEIDCSQMNFNSAQYGNGSSVLRTIILPTDPAMTTITDGCFRNIGSLTDICIPYNYKQILDGAFVGTKLKHLTTTDDYDGHIVDNGDFTYTFSANLEQLSSPDVQESAAEVFPANMGVKEVYSLATKVPKCYKNTFPYNLTFGYGGFIQDMVYCRDKYHNPNGEGEAIAVLRFPSKESFDRMPSELKEPEGIDSSFNNESVTDGYTKMVMKYTDPYRVFTKKDQTGAIDANGNPVLWPTHTETQAAWEMAGDGNIWTDYTYEPNGNNLEEITKKYKGQPSEEHYSFTDYIGWHQIVLTQATYVDPKEYVEDDVIKRYYEQAGWFTFCIPYNLTYSQVVKMLGIPGSAGNVESYLGGSKTTVNGVDTYSGGKKQLSDLMPDIRQLLSVTRTEGSGNNNNTIVFRLTTNLADRNNKSAKYLYFEEDKDNTSTFKYVYANQQFGEDGKPRFNDETGSPVLNNDEDPVCLVGGRPYIIRPYKRLGESIKSRNLGLYIMKRYADEFKETASCVNNEGTCEQLKSYEYTLSNDNKYIINPEGILSNEVTMKFAKPYEKHKVQAVDGAANSTGQLAFTDEDKVEHRYYYTMIGQFWEQDLPEYCVYQSGESWYRYLDTSLGFKWSPYKCVIMATPEVNSDKITEQDKPQEDAVMPLDHVKAKVQGTFRDVKNCYFPINAPNTKDVIPAPLKLAFFGRNDHIFTNQGPAGPKTQSTRYIFTMDDEEMIVDNGEGAPTAVKAIDMLDGEPQVIGGNKKIYNLSGQYVGNSTEGLSKGVYIVGGRKIVVD